MNQSISMNMTTKKFKVVLLGDQSTGKTSLIKRYAEKGFDPDSDVNFSTLKPKSAI